MPIEKPKRWFLSAAEVADLFGVSAKTVKRWIASKYLGGFKIARTGEHRVLVLQLSRFVREHPEASFVLERFNERYDIESPLREDRPASA